MSQKYAGAARPPRAPKQPLPPMSCDCHLHVFGDPARYPDRNPNPVHKSLEANWEDALAMMRALIETTTPEIAAAYERLKE